MFRKQHFDFVEVRNVYLHTSRRRNYEKLCLSGKIEQKIPLKIKVGE